MIRFAQRQLAAAMTLTALSLLTPTLAGEAAPDTAGGLASQLPIDAPPPKDYVVPAKAKDYIKKAVESPERIPQHKIHDAYRKPAEVLQLANIRPGNRVIEFSSYGNYWSTMISNIVGPKGELYMYDIPVFEPYAKFGQAFAEQHKNTKFQNIDHDKIELPKQVDVIVCVGCFHELLLTTQQMQALLTKMYKSMKPGGTFIVIFPRARDSTGTDDTGKLHRIDQEVVKGYAGGAGFLLTEEVRILWNNDDPRTKMVETETERDLADRGFFIFRKA